MPRTMRRTSPVARFAAAAALLLLAQPAPASAQELRLPKKDKSVKFAVMGDTGTASTAQFDVGKQMLAFHEKYPFEFVVMVGDNIYGGSSNPDAFRARFEAPYAGLLAKKVKFYASLGNHDDRQQVNYKLFNMDGKPYYTMKPSKGSVKFFALETTYLEPEQLVWLEKELQSSREDWKIPYFHHPPYSSGERHGSLTPIRTALEPLFLKYNVSVVFTGRHRRLRGPARAPAGGDAGGLASARAGSR